MDYITEITFVLGIIWFLLIQLAAGISFWEHERRASLLFFLISWPLLLLFSLPFLINSEIGDWLAFALLLLNGVLGILFMIPLQGKQKQVQDIPTQRIDERNTMFSRNELKQGSENFSSYYHDNPEHKNLDDKFRLKPGLLSPKSRTYNPFIFASANASFFAVGAFGNHLDGEVNETKSSFDTDAVTQYITDWSKKLGAVSIGFTQLKPYHTYSVKGRREQYGNEVVNTHKYAIALTVEMNKFNVDSAPEAPIVFESAQQYLSSGTMAVQIAQFIRELGFPAKAHIDGNYEVICPLVARDAGLGEIGRMGLLMTPELGPRVRIAVVTTDLPLAVKDRKLDHSVIHFCEICKKCATNCPSHAISFDPQENMEGVDRWQINSESCFTYWCSVGTDCGKCIQVCPYAHPNNLMHNIVRKGIQNNVLFRHLALKMDDFFYGKKPSTAQSPKWMQVN